MIHHYNCFLFIIIPPVTDVYMMLREERKTKCSQGKTGRRLDIKKIKML